MKLSELQKIEGLNLPTELPSIDDIANRLANFIADEKAIQSRMAPDARGYHASVARYQTIIPQHENLLTQLQQPNFQFEPESQPSVLSDLSDLSLPQVPSELPKNNFSTQNAAPTESNLPPQRHPTESKRSPSESERSSAESERSFAESEVSPTESDSLPRTQPTAPKSSLPLAPATKKSFSIYDRLQVERKLDADDLQELSISFAEHKNKRSPLDQLSPEIQFAIIELMSEHPAWMVAELLAQPAPIGLDFKTNDSSLSKWRNRHKKRAALAAQKKRQGEIQNILVSNNGDTFKSTVHLMESRLLKALSNDNTEPDDLQRISRSLATLRRQALAEGNPIGIYKPSNSTPNEK